MGDILENMEPDGNIKQARPTTVKPMTAPEEKATFRPRFRLSWAALAVRALELVAIFMPMKPARAE